jgi:hypothetical protein
MDVSKEVGLEVNTEKRKYMLLSRHQNAGKNHDIRIANLYFSPNIIRMHYAMKTYGGVNVQIHIYLDSALVGSSQLHDPPL